MGNIIIVTHWLDGDVLPFIRIGKVLKKRGHDVTLITHCYFERMANEAGFAFEPLDTPEEYAMMVEDMNRIEAEEYKRNGNMSEHLSFHRKYENNEVRIKEYNKIIKYCNIDNTIILCKNRSSIAAYLVAEKLRLPLISVLMNPTETTSMLLYENMYGDEEVLGLNLLRHEVGLPPITSWLQWECSAKMTLALWPTWYDETETGWPTKITRVGFPLDEVQENRNSAIPKEFLLWLQENPNPIVITGGTTKLLDETFYIKSIEACEVFGKPTIVLTRYREMLPNVLPSNVIWYKYLPLDDILPEMGLIIHHGGMGTLSGAMKANVPQLILPYHVDRPYNAALIKKIGVGDYLFKANWQTDKIVNKMNQLYMLDKTEKYMDVAKKMEKNQGVSEAANHVEYCLTHSEYVYEINTEGNKEISKKEQRGEQRNIRRDVLNSLSGEQKERLLHKIKKSK